MKLSVLMTVYNEADFIEYAMKSCLPYVDHLVIVEGAYQETIKLGASPRSTDGTIEKIEKMKFYYDPMVTEESHAPLHGSKIVHVEANECSDKDQRNFGLKKIRETNKDGFLLIVDGDEVYKSQTFDKIRLLCSIMRRYDKYVAYFKSKTFINGFEFFTNQYFPRLFDLNVINEFWNDNHVSWAKLPNGKFVKPEDNINILANVSEDKTFQNREFIEYFHFSFCKNKERFLLKRNWWMNRGFGKDFDYGWNIDENGKITDKNHKVFKFTGEMPSVIKEHPLWKKIV